MKIHENVHVKGICIDKSNRMKVYTHINLVSVFQVSRTLFCQKPMHLFSGYSLFLFISNSKKYI